MDDQTRLMSITDIVASTAEAAFASDQDGRLVAWNEAAERLLGYPAARLLGRRCYEVLGGIDIFGNCFCDRWCPLRRMAGRQEAVSSFQLDLQRHSGATLRLDVSALVLLGEEDSRFVVLHLLRPVADRHHPGAIEAVGAASRPDLTRCELEVLGMVAEGTATRGIAEALFISTATVRNHIQHILHKLGAHSRLEAVAVARRTRLI